MINGHLKECSRYHIVDRVAPGDDAGADWIFEEARHAYGRWTRLLMLGKVPQRV